MTSTDSETAFRRGPGGRPTRAEAERRHDVLLRTAADLFFRQGLQGVSIDAVAQAAGVAKRFIYARYANKDELFVAAVERLIADRSSALWAFDPGDAPAEEGLFRFAQLLLEITLDPETLALFRTLLIEGPRFPELTRLDSERNRHKGLLAVLRVFDIYAKRGEMKVENPELLVELFGSLVVRSAQHRALILGAEDPAQLEKRTRAAVRLFLDGCRPR